MHALGWEVWGCDLDAEKVERARSALGVSTIRAGAFQQLEFPEGYFDAVVLWSVIEHFHEPAAELLRVNRLLRAGGRVVIGTRNPLSAAARLFGRYWAGWDVPRHLVIFSPKGLVDMLRTRGFRVDRVRPSAWMSGFPDSLAFLLRGRLGCGVWGGRIHRLLYYLFFPLVSLSIAAGNWEVLEVTAVKVRDIGDQDILTNELERTARTG
jgi:SAM-dependent methyltransferase